MKEGTETRGRCCPTVDAAYEFNYIHTETRGRCCPRTGDKTMRSHLFFVPPSHRCYPSPHILFLRSFLVLSFPRNDKATSGDLIFLRGNKPQFFLGFLIDKTTSFLMYVSSYYILRVLILLYMCPHTTKLKSINAMPLSSTRVLMLLVQEALSYEQMWSSTTTFARSLLVA